MPRDLHVLAKKLMDRGYTKDSAWAIANSILSKTLRDGKRPSVKGKGSR